MSKLEELMKLNHVEQPKSDEERIAELEEKNAKLEAQNEMLTECLMELADIIYA